MQHSTYHAKRLWKLIVMFYDASLFYPALKDVEVCHMFELLCAQNPRLLPVNLISRYQEVVLYVPLMNQDIFY